MTLKTSLIIGAIVMTLLTSTIAAAIPNVYASGLGRSDFEEHPERFCAGFGPSNEDLCADLDICDDEGEINSTHGYCTGEIVSHLAYPPGGCPVGYHSYTDDESGFCYRNDLGCQYEGMIFRPDRATCGYIDDVCQQYPGLDECTVTINLGTPQNEDPQNCERSVPDHCLEPYLPRGYTFNGTWIQGNDLNCYGLKPLSDFRVTIEDQRRHQLDEDYDGIACENNDK